jgi:ComEC/Rec2-related protein
MASPLLRWTLGYLVGILLADALRPSLFVVHWLGLGGLLLFLIAVAGRCRPEPALPLIAGILGLWAGAQTQSPRTLGHPEARLSAPNEPWVLHGVVREDVRQTATATLVPLSVATLGRLGIASGATIDPAGRPQFWRSQPPLYVDLFVDGTLHESLLPGDTLRAAANLRDGAGHSDESPWEVPGGSRGPQLRAYAQADGLLRISTSLPEVPTGDRGGLELRAVPLRLAARARRALTRAHDAAWGQLPTSLQSVEPNSPTLSALQLAMSLGDRGPLQRRDAERAAAGKSTIAAVLRAAGVYHILSVSGLHLSVVGLTFYALCRWICRWIGPSIWPWICRWICHWIWRWIWRWIWPWTWRRTSQYGGSPAAVAPIVGQRWAALITLPVILFYALLTGAEPPTVRAAITLFAALLAIACGRRARLSTGLALAALWSGLPLGPDSGPQSLFSPSLVLSFAATLGIAYLRPLGSLLPDSRRDAAPDPAGALPGARRRLRELGRRALALLLRLCDASVAAILATAPLLAYYFAEFQGGALFGNLLVTPLAEFVLLPCGLLAALVALIHPSLALPLIVLSSLSGRLALALATQVAALGLGCQVAAPGRGVLVLWYLGLCLSPWRRRLGPLLSGVALLIFLLSWLPAWMRPWPLPQLNPGNGLRLSFIDTGQGCGLAPASRADPSRADAACRRGAWRLWASRRDEPDPDWSVSATAGPAADRPADHLASASRSHGRGR